MYERGMSRLLPITQSEFNSPKSDKRVCIQFKATIRRRFNETGVRYGGRFQAEGT